MKKIITVLIVVILVVAGFFAYKYFTAPKVDDIAVDVVLENADELTTQKMIISDVIEDTKGSVPLINKKKYLVKFKTTVEAGFDISDVTVKEDETKILVTLPHCTINEESIKIKASDLKFYDTNFSMFNPSADAVQEIVVKAEKKAKKIACSDEYGFLEAADLNARNVMQGLFESVANGREVVVKFQD